MRRDPAHTAIASYVHLKSASLALIAFVFVAAFATLVAGRTVQAGNSTATYPDSPINRQLERLRFEEMIGAMVMLGFEGRAARHSEVRLLRRAIAAGYVGGVMVMGRNISSPQQLIGLTGALHDAAAERGLLVSVDQEGGFVQRLNARNGFTNYPSAQWMARKYGIERARADYRAMAAELSVHGINFNLGPVLDLDRYRANPIIGRLRRSYGASPDEVAPFASTFVRAHRNAGVLTSAKHFPGHGSSRGDTHKGFVDISRTWSEAELAPFTQLLDADLLDSVMIGHLYHKELTGEDRKNGKRLPASLSPRIVSGLLREQIGFDGVIITDDLEMDAIRDHFGLRDAIIRAVNAGVDIVLTSKSRIDPDTGQPLAHRIISEAVQDGQITAQRVVAAYRRIEKLKKSLRSPQPASQAQDHLPDAPTESAIR